MSSSGMVDSSCGACWASREELVLETIGRRPEGDRIGHMWSDFVALTGRSRPGEFDITFPRELLERLREFVIGGCRSLGLKAYLPCPTTSGTLHITSLLGEAWDQFNLDPGGFAAWESMRIHEVKEQVGA